MSALHAVLTDLLRWPDTDLPLDAESGDATSSDNKVHIYLATRLRTGGAEANGEDCARNSSGSYPRAASRRTTSPTGTADNLNVPAADLMRLPE